MYASCFRVLLRPVLRGNNSIILVDSQYKILLVLRTFRPTIPATADPSSFQSYETGETYRLLEKYINSPRSTYEEMTPERLHGILTRAPQTEDLAEEEEVNALMPAGGMGEVVVVGKGDKGTTGKKKFKKKEGRDTVRRALLSGAAEYGSQLIEEIIRIGGVDGNALVKSIADDGKNPLPPQPSLLERWGC